MGEGGRWERWAGQSMGDPAAAPRGSDSPIGQESRGKDLPRCSQSDLCLRQLPPAAAWGVRIDIEEAGSLGKKG